MIVCYLNADKKNINIETQRLMVTKWAAEHQDLPIEKFIENENFSTFTKHLSKETDTAVFANIVCLGSSFETILNNATLLFDHASSAVFIAEDLVITKKNKQKFLYALKIALKIRMSLFSITTKQALAEKKASGIRLGRKSRNKKRILDNQVQTIIERKLNGQTNAQIAKDLGVHQVTLYQYMRNHPEIRQTIQTKSG
ncbi:MAG: hypothetical protein J6C85_04670 [Alphaproteobacteria bacterium]|nr:hypothetical protein [Alphaproteobacteria bacterium]